MTGDPTPDNLGLYLSIPFCRAKCTFCNFSSDTFAGSRMPAYVDQICREIAEAPATAAHLGATLPTHVDTLYFGGGTPSLLPPDLLRHIFNQLRQTFRLSPTAEVTIECAPGQLSDDTLAELLRQGVNRISLGVQSFVDRESAAVGRHHTSATCVAEIARLQQAGLSEISLDLIAGLPHQTVASWRHSLTRAISLGIPHISIYLLEVDVDSRLGREALAAGPRYSAPDLPTDDQAADFYAIACDLLHAAGLPQYEISNFARPGPQSRHNLKYWRRHPYLGFGLDAHSMLQTPSAAVRFANTDDLTRYLSPEPKPTLLPQISRNRTTDRIDHHAAFEETLFLGLRLNAGVDLHTVRQTFGPDLLLAAEASLADLTQAGLLTRTLTHTPTHTEDRLQLTPHGRLLSNEVFSRLLLPTAA